MSFILLCGEVVLFAINNAVYEMLILDKEHKN